MKSDIELLDFLKLRLGFSTDVQLANYLGLTKHTIYKIRATEVNLGPLQRLKILDKLGYLKAATHIKSVAPGYLAKAIAEQIQDSTAVAALSGLGIDESPAVDIHLLALVKRLTNSNTDEELALKIGLKRTSLSMVRKGKAKFGLYPRIKILKLLDPNANLCEFEKALDSSEALLIIAKRFFGDSGDGQ